MGLVEEREDRDRVVAAVFRPRRCPSRVVVAVVIARGIMFLASTLSKSSNWMRFGRDEIEELKNFLFA